jgi:probable rRNA maturation factor
MILIEPAQSPPLPGGSAGRRWPVSKRELTRFLAEAQQLVGLEGRVYVLLTDDDTIRHLNEQYRRKKKPTDVLSFPALAHTYHGRVPIAGDLAISLETAARQAAPLNHSLETETKILMLHGLLHLDGMDHETDSGQMARRESRLRKQLELPTGLIQRSSLVAGPQSTAAGKTTKRAKAPAKKTVTRKTTSSRPPAKSSRSRKNKR